MVRLGKPLIFLAMIGIAYWYWTGPYQHSARTPPEDNPKKNAEIMAKCIAGENFAIADGTRDPGEDPEAVCADAYNLVEINGEWYRK